MTEDRDVEHHKSDALTCYIHSGIIANLNFWGGIYISGHALEQTTGVVSESITYHTLAPMSHQR